MLIDVTIDRFFAELDKNPNAIGMFHARLTTHGTTHVENNHPFRVDGRKDIVLGHNGMLPVTIKPGDKRSDTRIFAEDLLPSMGVGVLDDPAYFKQLEDWARGSKIAILNTSPDLKDDVYILNEKDGHWADGVWWSNTSYKSRSYWATSYTGGYYNGYASKEDYDFFERDKHLLLSSDELLDADGTVRTIYDVCYHCYSHLREDDYNEGACTACNTCIDCNEHMAHCMCYTPNSTVRSNDYWWKQEQLQLEKLDW
jgi:predicted glutamine amidotransferase